MITPLHHVKHFNRMTLMIVMLCLVVEFPGSSSSLAASPSTVHPPDQANWTVALDGTGTYISIQEAIDASKSGDTIWIKAGTYAEDVTVHSKEGLKIIGERMDLVVLSGLKRVGTLHIGKWPYGARNVEIHNLTVNQHGGLGLGIFNGGGILLKKIHIKGMVFGQEVEDVTIEDCVIGGSETTGIAFANSKATLIGNFIHDNDHGVSIGGTSQVLLTHNVITRSLFEGIMVHDTSTAKIIQNTIVHNGGGIAFHDTSQGEAHGNILTDSQVGFLFSPQSQTTFSFNVLFANDANYLLKEQSNVPAPPDRQSQTDLNVAPTFVQPEKDDYRLVSNTKLRNIGTFQFLGALPPVDSGS